MTRDDRLPANSDTLLTLIDIEVCVVIDIADASLVCLRVLRPRYLVITRSLV